jgi:hypothetical protein
VSKEEDSIRHSVRFAQKEVLTGYLHKADFAAKTCLESALASSGSPTLLIRQDPFVGTDQRQLGEWVEHVSEKDLHPGML